MKHAENCTEQHRCTECKDTERYVQLVKQGMSPADAQALTDRARKNRHHTRATLLKPLDAKTLAIVQREGKY